MKAKPLFDRVVIKMIEADETTKSGIILTGESKEKPQIADVIAVGKDVKVVSVGDKVMVNKYAGAEIKLEKQVHTVIKEIDILAIVTD